MPTLRFSRRSTSGRLLSGALAASLLVVLLSTRFTPFVPTVQAGSHDIVTNQISGGGNAGATYTRDFVELLYRGTSPVSLMGKSMQYMSATGMGNFALGATLSPAQSSALILISQVQGSGTSSPVAGTTVTVRGIVTLLKSNGFFLQEEAGDNDANPNTSEGISIFTSAAPLVSVGAQVTVTGTVAEFNNLTEISTSNANVIINSTGNPLPTAVTLTAADLPPTANFSQPQLEKYEGMRLFASSLTTVAPNDSLFDVPTVLTGQPRPLREPGIPISDPVPPDPTSGTLDPNIPRWDENPERLILDTNGRAGSTGETLTSNVVITNVAGPLDYAFGAYRLINEAALTRSANMSAVPVPTPTASEFTVASYNIENFNNSSATQRQKAADTIRNLLHYPDIIGLIEIDDLAHLQALRDEINNDAVAAGHPNPQYAAYLFEGNSPGGGDVDQNVGFLVKTTRVSVTSVTQERKNETYTPPGGTTTFLHDRPPLVLDATVNQTGTNPQRVIVIVNHLRSFVDIELVGGQGPGVREKRKKQAESLADLLNDLQTANPTIPVISVGDYNAFQFNNGYDDPISVIKGTPTPDSQIVVDQSPDLVNPDFFNLIDDLPASERYTFISEGTPQALDHHLVNTVARALNTRASVARVNADFPAVPAAAFASNAARPERNSDHDPVVSYYALNTTPPAPSLSINDVTQSEGNSGTTTFTFNVTLSSSTHSGVTFNICTADNTAQDDTPASEDNDYQSNCLTNQTIANGSSSRQFTVTVNGDTFFEPNETFFVNVTNVTGANVTDGQGVGTIANDDTAPSFSIADVTLSEGNAGTKSLPFTITLSQASNITVTVDYQTTNGTASAGSDYQSTSGTLTFNPGELQKTVTVLVNGDTQNESNETFFVNLSNPQNATVSDSQGLGTIVNDDAPGVQFSSANYSINEGANNTPQGFGSLSVEVIRTGDTTQPATVRYFTSDNSGGNECNQVTGQASQRCDYTLVAGTLRFAAGEATKTISIPIINDGYVEGSEFFSIQLRNPTGATLGTTTQATATIQDDDTTATTAANNPYLNNSFFVRMNYLDFLGREPDANGFNDWTNVLNNCGPEKGFLGAPKSCDRAHVSHGFFASTEFIDSGYLAYRMYQVGMGRLPRYSEFSPDMAALSGFGLTDAVKQQNLQDYLQEFTSRAEFTNRFSDSLQPSQAALLIQKLEQAAGVTLPATATTKPGQPTQYSRQQLIDLRANGTFTVGQTLKAFVEQQVVYDRYFTSGEVTMMYFAFLRRDPDLNDPNLVGWNDWVNVFTNGGQRSDGTVIEPRDIHHLIFGFIYSEEYRKRFGQP